MLKWIVGVLVVIVVALLGFLGYMGVFSSASVSEKVMGPYVLVYDSFIGPYNQTGKVFDKIYNGLKAEGITSSLGMGVYYDDPAKVAPEKLRSDCGVVLEQKDVSKAWALRRKFKVMNVSKTTYIVAEFPLRNILSYMIAPAKGYAALGQYLKGKGYKMGTAMELYDMKAGKILFLVRRAK